MVDGERFELRTDRVALRRLYRRLFWLIVPVNLLLAAVLGAQVGLLANVLDSTTSAMLYGAGFGLLIFGLAWTVFGQGSLAWLRIRRVIDPVLVADRRGVWLAVPQSDAGSVFLPWPAVGQIVPRRSLRHTVLSIRLAPGIRPDHPGASGLDDRRIWRHLNRQGLQVGPQGTNATGDQVLAALHHFATQARADHRTADHRTVDHRT
jgi:hypothetical protein